MKKNLSSGNTISNLFFFFFFLGGGGGVRFIKGPFQQARFKATICSTFCSEVEYNMKFPVSRPFVRHVRKRTELECKLPLISAVFFQWSDCNF